MWLAPSWPRPTSLRARIALAFVVLILTSATCTIVIGNAIFARKANELARARLQADLNVAEALMLTRQALLRALVGPLATQIDVEDRRLGERLCALSPGGRSFDFAALLDAPQRQATLVRPQRCAAVALSGASAGALLGSDLGAFAATAADGEPARSGLVVLQAAELRAVAGATDGSRPGLCSVAARRLRSGQVLLLGSLVSGRLESLAESVGLGPGDVDLPRDVSIDLGGERTAATHQAYLPLRDFRGAAVGRLGIARGEDVYGEIWRRTALLFSTIIAGGMTFGFLMAWFFSVTLTRPLQELADGMARVANGDLDLKIRADSGDELGQLSQAFNVMVRGVKERDLRLREATSEKLSQVEKQVSVGRLAAGVAHEINNPMTAILSLSMLLRRGLAPDDPRREDLDVVITETTRCREIVRRLLDFAQERPPEKRIVDVSEVVRETLALTARYEALAQVRVEVRLAQAPLFVDADAKQLQQVFTNLILNAAEAMRPGGTITVTSDEDSSGGFAVVKVEDTGKGIPRECLPRVFEPFFTTKGSGKGTGLGLSVSLGIVRKHDGAIDIESEEDRGTTVTITIPRVEPQPASRAGGAS